MNNRKRHFFSLRALAMFIGLYGLITGSSEAAIAADNTSSPVKILAFGDSLTAGFMLPPNASFPAQLEVALAGKGYKVEVINAGVSGDTSAGGLQRLDWSLQEKPDGVILELGANDALRGIDPKITRANMEKLLNRVKAHGADLLLAGMRAPSNWGPEYQAQFDGIYTDLSGKAGVPLYPFFLENVLGKPGMTMDDGLHPTEKGVSEIVRQILPQVEEMVKRITARRGAAASP